MHQIGQRSAAKQQNVLHLIADLIVEAVEGCYSNERGMGYSSQGHPSQARAIGDTKFHPACGRPILTLTNTRLARRRIRRKRGKRKQTHQVFVAFWGVRVVGRGRELGKGGCQLESAALPCHPLTHKGWLEGAFLHILIHSFFNTIVWWSICLSTHSLTHSPIHSLTHSLAHSLTHSIIHLFIHSVICSSQTCLPLQAEMLSSAQCMRSCLGSQQTNDDMCRCSKADQTTVHVYTVPQISACPLSRLPKQTKGGLQKRCMWDLDQGASQERAALGFLFATHTLRVSWSRCCRFCWIF